MKKISATSPFFPSSHRYRILALKFLLLFTLILTSFNSAYPEYLHHHNTLHVGRGHHYCHPTADRPPPPICYQLQRIRYYPPFPPPPPAPDDGDEIDPRYGVEKRLVPSGPNPLHN